MYEEVKKVIRTRVIFFGLWIPLVYPNQGHKERRVMSIAKRGRYVLL